MKEFRELGQGYTRKWFANISWRTNWQGQGWRQKWEVLREWGCALRCALCSASFGGGGRGWGGKKSSISLFAAYPWLCMGRVSRENGKRAVLLFLMTRKEWEDQQAQGEEPKSTTQSPGAFLPLACYSQALSDRTTAGETPRRVHQQYMCDILKESSILKIMFLRNFQTHKQRAPRDLQKNHYMGSKFYQSQIKSKWVWKRGWKRAQGQQWIRITSEGRTGSIICFNNSVFFYWVSRPIK